MTYDQPHDDCIKARVDVISHGETRTHDYFRCRQWGHDYTFEPIQEGRRGRMMGWGIGIKAGDFLLLDNRGKETRYKVERIHYFPDPVDQWRADVVFAPRGRG